MSYLIMSRIITSVIMLLVISVILFVGVQLLPGSAADAILGQSATPEAVAALNRQLGLDQPALYRYFHWLAGLLTGHLGDSYATQTPFAPALWMRLKNSLILAGFTMVIAVPLSLVLGITCARYQGRLLDRLLTLFSRATVSLPEFFSGYLLILLFAVILNWLPSNSAPDSSASLSDNIVALLLPALTLVLAILGHMTNMTRAALINIQDSPWVDMALMKGLTPTHVLIHHVLPNAWGPIINVIALNLAYLLVGVVIVENVFVYPGIGQYIVDAISKRDIPVVQDSALILAAFYILLNFIADVITLISNPRLLHHG